jgi:siroheme synthase-like protein
MKRLKREFYYPIFLNLNGKRCMVIGGGVVALRKIKGLLECKADITVISPVICSELKQVVNKWDLRVIHRRYRTGDLTGSEIAIVATRDGNLNKAVAEEARSKSILVNVVDNPKLSDFIVPSCMRNGDIAVAISTNGRSPALARKIRVILEKELGEDANSLLDVITEVRSEAKSLQVNCSGDDWQHALDLELLKELLKKGKRKMAKAILRKSLKLNRINRA